MTPTNSLPAQTVAAKSMPKASGDGGEQAKGAGQSSEGGKGFAALFSQMMGEAMVGSGLPEGEAAAGTEGEPLPKRPRDGKTKSLQPEDVLPSELLMTLYPQAAPPPRPQGMGDAQIAADAMLRARHGADLTAGLPAAQLPAADKPVAEQNGAPQSAASAAFAAALASAEPRQAARAAEPAANAIPVQQAAAAATLSPAVQQAVAPLAGQQQNGQSVQKTAAAPPARPVERAPDAGQAGLSLAAEANAEALASGAPSTEAESELPPLTADQVRESRLSVTRQETTLAQSGQPPVAHQAAERIISELKSASEAQPAAGPHRGDLTQAQQPVRTLHIQLQPADLGLLTVKMSLRESGLDIKLEAADHRTARLLESDKDRLTDMLRTAGYVVDGLAVQFSPAEKPAPAFQAFASGQADNGQQSGGQWQPGGAQSDAQRGNQSGRGSDQGGAFPSHGDEGDQANPTRSADGDLYL